MSDSLVTENVVVSFTLFLVTYLVHSTMMLGVTLLLFKLPGFTSFSLRDALLKTALIGSLLTTAIHLAFQPHSFLGKWEVHQLSANTIEHTPKKQLADSPPINLRESIELDVLRQKSQDETESASEIKRLVTGATGSRSSAAAKSAFGWPVVVTTLWFVGLVLSLARSVSSRIQLRKRLRSRRDVVSGELPKMLRQICRHNRIRSSIRLTESRRISSPIVVSCGEICLPQNAVSTLSEELQESMLAHEIAHIVRRDHLWLLTGEWLQSVFFFQPLIRIVRDKMKEAAEFLSDDWAVRHTGRPISLATCLAEVAAWLRQQPHALPTVGMAEMPSPLVRRVHRLVNSGAGGTQDLPKWLHSLMAAGLFLLVLILAPNFAAATREQTAEVSASQPTRRNMHAEILTTHRENVYAIQVTWRESYDDRRLKVNADGHFSFSDDDREITYLSPNSYMSVEERRAGTERKVELQHSRGDKPRFTFWQDGRSRPMNKTDRAWFENMLLEFIREVNVYDRHRAGRILEDGGSEALKEEIDLIRSAAARKVYERVLQQAQQNSR